jgi:hypothetical protein
VEVAGQLLVTAGDSLDRLLSDASFAHLCGAAPLPASSGRTDCHRLNRWATGLLGGHVPSTEVTRAPADRDLAPRAAV